MEYEEGTIVTEPLSGVEYIYAPDGSDRPWKAHNAPLILQMLLGGDARFPAEEIQRGIDSGRYKITYPS